jgi:hypothetical protein
MTDAGSCEEYAVAAIRPWFGSSVRGTAYDSSTYSNRLRHPHPHPHPHPLRFGISPVSGYKRNRHEADCQRTFPKMQRQAFMRRFHEAVQKKPTVSDEEFLAGTEVSDIARHR